MDSNKKIRALTCSPTPPSPDQFPDNSDADSMHSAYSYRAGAVSAVANYINEDYNYLYRSTESLHQPAASAYDLAGTASSTLTAAASTTITTTIIAAASVRKGATLPLPPSPTLPPDFGHFKNGFGDCDDHKPMLHDPNDPTAVFDYYDDDDSDSDSAAIYYGDEAADVVNSYGLAYDGRRPKKSKRQVPHVAVASKLLARKQKLPPIPGGVIGGATPAADRHSWQSQASTAAASTTSRLFGIGSGYGGETATAATTSHHRMNGTAATTTTTSAAAHHPPQLLSGGITTFTKTLSSMFTAKTTAAGMTTATTTTTSAATSASFGSSLAAKFMHTSAAAVSPSSSTSASATAAQRSNGALTATSASSATTTTTMQSVFGGQQQQLQFNCDGDYYRHLSSLPPVATITPPNANRMADGTQVSGAIAKPSN